MTNYRLPMDADGVKYHGTVDQNEENPGHFMYGLDENGNKRIIRTDEQGNVLTRVTGSIVERVSLTEQAGTVPAGTWKRITRDDDGNELRDIRNNADAISASLFFRRESGELAEAVIAFGGYLSVEREPSLAFNFIRSSPTTINQSHK